MTPDEMREAAVKTGESGLANEKTVTGQVGAAVIVAMWTIGAEIVEALNRVEDAVYSLESTYDQRTR